MNLQRFRDLVARLAKERTDHERPALEVGTEMHKSMEEELVKNSVALQLRDVIRAKKELSIKQQLRDAFVAFCGKHGVDAEALANLDLATGEHIHIVPELAKERCTACGSEYTEDINDTTRCFLSPLRKQQLLDHLALRDPFVRKFGWGFGRPTGLGPAIRVFTQCDPHAIAVQTPATTSDNRRITSTVPCDGHKGERHDAVKVSFCKDQDAWLCAECRQRVGLDPKEGT